MSAQELEDVPTSTPRSTATHIMEVPPDDDSLHGASLPDSRRSSAAVLQDDPGPDALGDDSSVYRQSLWGSGRSSPAVLKDEAEESGDDLSGSTAKPPEDESGCRGKNGYVYPFKLKPEERYPIKDPASYTEFEKRYPPDRFGEEASDNARVWKLYRDRVTERDEDQIEGWNKTLDILLIFAGLFSAVATAFIIEAYKRLQPDYTEIMAKSFLASLNGTSVIKIESFSQFRRPPLARCVNTLWFLSLTLALVVALLAILAKQWLGEYNSRMRRHISSQRRWAWRHFVYHAGLEKWGMEAFISALPLMLHLSLILFLVGLVVFLTDLDWVIVAFVLVLTVAVVVFYACATVAPLWFGDCPTATPILDQGRRALESLNTDLRRRLLSLRKSISRRLKIQSWCEDNITSTTWNTPAYDEEVLLQGAPALQDAMALRWMVISLPAVEEIEVALDAIGSLDPLEHRHEFHTNSNGVESDVPAEGDALCLGPVLIAATTRFRWMCEGASGSDPAGVARCIRTLLSLSVESLWDLNLPFDSKYAAMHSLHRWADIPTHDLNFVCMTFRNQYDSYKNWNTRRVVQAWTDDAGPVTGQTPFLPSSIALCFLHYKRRFAEDATSTALVYSTLSASVACLASDPTRRRTALNVLHDAAIVYSQEFRDIRPAEARSAMDTPQQLYFRAMSTIGVLRNALPNDATKEIHRILSTNFVRLVSTFPGVETLTLEHISHVRGILDMTPHLKPEDGEVARKLLKLMQDYLCRLTDWSDHAGETTRRLIELYIDSLPNSDAAASLAFWLSQQSHHNIFSTSEMAARHSLVNLLLPGTKGELSAWRTLCNTSPHALAAYDSIHLAHTLASLLIILMRRGFDVTSLVKEFLGDGRLCNLIFDARFKYFGSVHLAQHARELSPEWWEDTKMRLQSLANAHDGDSSNLLAEGDGGGSIVMPPSMTNFVQKVDALDGHCQTCDFDELKWEKTTQNGVSGKKRASVSLLARAYHQARRVIIENTRRGRSEPVSDAEAHEVPVITVLPPVEPHASLTSPARASVTSAHDGSV